MKAEKKTIRDKISLNIPAPYILQLCIILLLIVMPAFNRTASGKRIHIALRKQTPTLTEMISKDYLSSEEPAISPDGKRIIYFVRKVDWAKNCFREYCYLYNNNTGITNPLYTDLINSNVRWFDNRFAGYLRNGDVHIYDTIRKKSKKVIKVNGIVTAFETFGTRGVIALATLNSGSNSEMNFNYYGNIEHVEEELEHSSIYYIPDFRKSGNIPIFDSNSDKSPEFTDGLVIKSFTVSESTGSIYLNTLPNNSRIYWKKNRVIRISISGTLNDMSRTISHIKIPSYCELVCTSPDGTSGHVRSWGKDPKIFNRDRLYLVELNDNKDPVLKNDLLSGLDRQPVGIRWNSSGLYLSYWDRTRIGLIEIRNGSAKPILTDESVFPRLRFDLSENGDIAFIGGDMNNCFNLYLAEKNEKGKYLKAKKLSDIGKESENWNWGTNEIIEWESSDGVMIEGILRKPSDYDPNRKYPLIFMAHGGPMWADLEFREDISEMYYYPVLQLLSEDIMILKPNYRGSRGYGEIFSSSKTGRNMGLFSLWDLEGAINKLAEENIIDRDRVGCMGWSHGGYISAFTATNSEMFKAVSVGGGTSDFGIYASNNEISCEVTRDFLGSNPMERNTDLYKATSPCGNITPFTSPTLIQHGQVDSVSPLQNAKELYRGLKENDVPVEFFIFNRMGHGISSPKESRALLSQNFVWFTHYLKGKKLDFLNLKRP